MQQPPPQHTLFVPSSLLISSEFWETSNVEARRFFGVTSLDCDCRLSMDTSSTDESVSWVEASESLAYSDAIELVVVELVEIVGDCAL